MAGEVRGDECGAGIATVVGIGRLIDDAIRRCSEMDSMMWPEMCGGSVPRASKAAVDAWFVAKSAAAVGGGAASWRERSATAG